MKGKFSLYICGCRGSRSVFGAEYAKFGGQTTCFILKEADYALVVDCGTGLYSAREIVLRLMYLLLTGIMTTYRDYWIGRFFPKA